jgi:hypothetical protein
MTTLVQAEKRTMGGVRWETFHSHSLSLSLALPTLFAYTSRPLLALPSSPLLAFPTPPCSRWPHL